MTIISKLTGGLGIAACLYDMHKTALISANNGYVKATSDAFLKTQIGASKTERLSYKDTQIKNWTAKNNLFIGVKSFFGRTTGYVKGFLQAAVRYIPNFALAGIALFAGKKGNSSKLDKVANAAAIGLGALEAGNFIVNAAAINQKTDYLE